MTPRAEPFEEARGHLKALVKQGNSKGSCEFCRDRGLGTAAASEEWWGQKPVWSRWRNEWAARKASCESGQVFQETLLLAGEEPERETLEEEDVGGREGLRRG